MDTLKDLLAVKVFAPAMERWRGVDSRRFLSDVERLQNTSLSEIREHQLRRLRKIVAAAESFPIYVDRIAGADISHAEGLSFQDFRRLQPVGREDIRTLAENVENRGLVDSRVIRSATGGTTSAPVTFYMDREAAEHRWAATRYFDGSLGYEPGRKIAYLWGAIQDIPNYHGIKGYLRKEWIERRKFIPATQLSDEQMLSHYNVLREFKPRLLQAYPSALKVFADFLVANDLKLHIPAITCTAELLTEEQRDSIQRAFGLDPIQWYGARDAGRIAMECTERDGLHINCYGLYVEVGQRRGIGRLLITDLWNTLMPIVRYEIGDVAELVESPCACGSQAPRLKNIVGRVADMLIGADGRLVPGVAMVNRIITDSAEIKGLQVIQHDLGEFTIRVVTGKEYQGDVSVRRLKTQLDNLLEAQNKLRIEIIDDIPQEPSGKVRICKNEMSAERLRQFV